MTSEIPSASKSPWVQTTSGVIIVNGVVTAVVSSLVTALINNVGTLPWNSIALTFGIIAVVVFLLLSVFRARLREMIWKRPAVYLWSLRPVSHRALDREIADGRQRVRAIAHGEALKILESAEEDRNRQQAIQRLGETLGRIHENLPFASTDPAYADMQFEELPEELRADYVPSTPRPEPRFFIRPPGEGSAQMAQWTLENRIERSSARNVRIEQGRKGRFAFNDGAFWDEMSGRDSVTFEGRIVSADSDGDVQLVLTYLDGANHAETVYFWIRGESTDPVEGFPDRSLTV